MAECKPRHQARTLPTPPHLWRTGCNDCPHSDPIPRPPPGPHAVACWRKVERGEKASALPVSNTRHSSGATKEMWASATGQGRGQGLVRRVKGARAQEPG